MSNTKEFTTVGAGLGLFLGGIVWVLAFIANSHDFTAGLGVANTLGAANKAGGAVFLTCALLGAVVGFFTDLKEMSQRQQAKVAEQKRQREQAEEAAEHQRHEQEADLQMRKYHLSRLLSDSRQVFLTIPELVPAAERHLHRAERDFAEGAFAPFWDEIERATNKLADYQQRIQTINRNALEYQTKTAELPKAIARNEPPFALPTGELCDARPTATRLAAIVRKAQKNFQFATIYEQRKTNQILVAGFGTLGSAIYALGDAISSSLDDLSHSLHTSLDKVLDATHEHSELVESLSERHAELLTEHFEKSSKEAAADARARRKYEEDSLEKQDEQNKMLDNIQRGKKPWP